MNKAVDIPRRGFIKTAAVSMAASASILDTSDNKLEAAQAYQQQSKANNKIQGRGGADECISRKARL